MGGVGPEWAWAWIDKKVYRKFKFCIGCLCGVRFVGTSYPCLLYFRKLSHSRIFLWNVSNKHLSCIGSHWACHLLWLWIPCFVHVELVTWEWAWPALDVHQVVKSHLGLIRLSKWIHKGLIWSPLNSADLFSNLGPILTPSWLSNVRLVPLFLIEPQLKWIKRPFDWLNGSNQIIKGLINHKIHKI